MASSQKTGKHGRHFGWTASKKPAVEQEQNAAVAIFSARPLHPTKQQISDNGCWMAAYVSSTAATCRVAFILRRRRFNALLILPRTSTNTPRRPKPAGPPWRQPSSIRRTGRKNLDRKLTAVFASHGTLDALDDGRNGRAVILELLGAVGDRNACTAADIFEICRLFRALKPPPASVQLTAPICRSSQRTFA